MRPRRGLLCSAGATALLLTACGQEDAGPRPAVGTTFAEGTSATTEAEQTTSAAATGEVADVEFEDQSGAGDLATVARVVLPVDGFVVLTADDGDDDEDEDDPVVGSTAVLAGESSEVPVPLSPPLTEDTELEATLYGDTDGDGLFDQSIDQQIPDSDGDDDVSDDAEYTVG
jgi:predicted RNA-binding protein with TRAM domain